MKNVYVFDACSVIALLTNEDGADVVKELLEKAINSEMKNPAASSGVSSFEKKKSYGLFSFCTGGLLPRHHWQRD
jgi:PIN domain nuclease of toxin-antitoxin system